MANVAIIGHSDIRALEKELERRELAADSGGITRIERVILFECEACGHKPDAIALGGKSRVLHGVRGTDTPGNGKLKNNGQAAT